MLGFVGTNMADTIVTYHLLTKHRSYVEESNPLLESLEGKPIIMAIAKTAATMVIAHGLVKMHTRRPWATFLITNAGSVFYTWAAVHNWKVNKNVPIPD